MSTIILIIGLRVFFARFLYFQFRKANVPDMLVLMLVPVYPRSSVQKFYSRALGKPIIPEAQDM